MESHQRSKADTSGTAKAVVQSFQELGVKKFTEVCCGVLWCGLAGWEGAAAGLHGRGRL